MGEPSGWEYFDVEADVGIHAWGPSLREAFAQAALGVFALIVALEDVQPRETRETRAQGDTPEALLVNWINECLYVHDIEGFVARQVELTRLEGGVAHGLLHGEEIDRGRHRVGTVVKAATLHAVQVTETADRADVRLVVDV